MKNTNVIDLYDLWLNDDSRKQDPTQLDEELWEADARIEDLMQQLNFTDEQKAAIADMEEKALHAGFVAGYEAAEQHQVPFGTYAAELQDLRVNLSNSYGLTALVVFRIQMGNYEDKLISFSKPLGNGISIAQMNNQLRKLTSHLQEQPEIHFGGWLQYADLVSDLADRIQKSGKAYLLDYTPDGYQIHGIIEPCKPM